MADSKKMTVEEVLAACRRMDSQNKDASSAAESVDAGQPAPAVSEQPPVAAAAAPAEPAAPAAKQKPGGMSVAEMLAAARAEKAPGTPAAAAAAPAESSEAPAAPAAPAKKPSQMSVADMLAAARAEKSAAKPAAAPAAPKSDAPKAAPPKAATAKPAAAKPAGEKAPAAKAPEAAKAGGPKDTTSILAAARGAKPGPMSKAQAAAAKTQPAAPAKKAAAVVVPPMPDRPAYLETPQPAAAPSHRRSFFGAVGAVMFGSSLALGFSSLFVTNLLWLLGLARFMFPNILTEPPTIFKVGFPSDYAPGQVETKYVAQYGVWIVRYEYNGQSQIYALRTVCTHLGCTPNWLEAEQKFKCPCHGSGFYKDGVNFEGPAPRPLERHVIRLADDGQLEVDKSRKFQEELGQWKDPSSFVPV